MAASSELWSVSAWSPGSTGRDDWSFVPSSGQPKPTSSYHARSKSADNSPSREGSGLSQYAHNSSLYKTELCRSYSDSGYCRYSNKCQFAHGLQDLRPVVRHRRWKTEKCKNFLNGSCPYGSRCDFIHHDDLIYTASDPLIPLFPDPPLRQLKGLSVKSPLFIPSAPATAATTPRFSTPLTDPPKAQTPKKPAGSSPTPQAPIGKTKPGTPAAAAAAPATATPLTPISKPKAKPTATPSAPISKPESAPPAASPPAPISKPASTPTSATKRLPFFQHLVEESKRLPNRASFDSELVALMAEL